jgi:transcriptional regulator with XRE-family HTH domain
MITRIREVRRAQGLTLLDVAERCAPPTTAQTIGRLETGTRTVSVGWLNRIAAALKVSAGDLVEMPRAATLWRRHPPPRPAWLRYKSKRRLVNIAPAT